MNDTKDRNAVAFEAWLSEWGKFYKWLNYIYIALKTGSRRKILYGKIELISSIDGHKPNDIRVESKNLLARRYLVPFAPHDLNKIRAVLNGQLDPADKHLLLCGREEGRFSYYYSSLYPPSVSEGPRRPSIVISGMQRHDLMVETGHSDRELSQELRVLDAPYDDINDLCTELGLSSFFIAGDACRVEITAYPVVGLKDVSEIRDGIASIRLWAAEGIDTSKIKFGYRLFHDGSVRRSSYKGSEFEWSKRGSLSEGGLDFKIGEVPALRAYVSYDGVSMQDGWIEDPTKRFNARYAAHQAVDRDNAVLKQFLSGLGARPGDDFEKGVAFLFHILGFAVSYFGDTSKLKENADLYAVTPRQRHLVIECTLKELDRNDKLSKVVGRAALLTRQLASSGNGHISVKPLIVSAATREELEADLEKAGEHGVIVIAKSELDELISRAAHQPDPEALYDELLRYVPSVDGLGLNS